MEKPTQQQFLEALWKAFTTARFEGLEWKFIEWIRDPCCKTLKITKAEFNAYFEQALEDSDEGRIGFDITVDDDAGEARIASVKRLTPVVVCGRRIYVMSMKPYDTSTYSLSKTP
jgi:hypothetical protein